MALQDFLQQSFTQAKYPSGTFGNYEPRMKQEGSPDSNSYWSPEDQSYFRSLGLNSSPLGQNFNYGMNEQQTNLARATGLIEGQGKSPPVRIGGQEYQRLGSDQLYGYGGGQFSGRAQNAANMLKNSGQIKYDPTYGWIAPLETYTQIAKANFSGGTLLDHALNNLPTLMAGGFATAGALGGLDQFAAGAGAMNSPLNMAALAPSSTMTDAPVIGAGSMGGGGAANESWIAQALNGNAATPLSAVGAGGPMDMAGSVGTGLTDNAMFAGPATASEFTVGSGQTAAQAATAAQGATLPINASGISRLSDPFTLGSAAIGLYDSNRQRDRAADLQRQLLEGFNRSDPFSPGRATALQQYQTYANDPNAYMSSPLAQMQIDQLNRAMRSKQAGLGQTFNIDPITGQVRGSGSGMNDFAKNLQTNLASQYETMLNNRATQAGMNLFPNPGFMQGASNNLANLTASDTGRARSLGIMAGAGRELFPEITDAWRSGVEGIRRGIFGA